MPTTSAYSVSKSALIRLTDNLDARLAGSGVHVVDLSPGRVKTPMIGDLVDQMPDDYWNDMELVTDAVLTLTSGRYEALAGRFLHAVEDEFDALLDVVAQNDDVRRMRLVPNPATQCRDAASPPLRRCSPVVTIAARAPARDRRSSVAFPSRANRGLVIMTIDTTHQLCVYGGHGGLRRGI